MKINLLLIALALCSISCVENYSGEKVYLTKCANCHGVDGKGLKRLIPSLVNSDYFIAHNQELSCIIQKGLHDSIYVNGILFHGKMPGNKDLNETDIVNLINYMHKKWYPDLPFVAPLQVRKQLSECKE